MKIIKSVENISAFKHPHLNSRVYFGSMFVEEEKISYQNYDNEFNWRQFIPINSESYQLKISLDDNTQGELQSLEGGSPDLPDTFIDTIIQSCVLPSDIYDNKLINYSRNFPKRRVNSLIVFDFNSKSYINIPYRSINNPVFNKCIYSLDSWTHELSKFDFDLNKLWQVQTKGTDACSYLKHNFSINSCFITFIGPERKAQQVVDGKAEHTYSGGELTAFNDNDGSVKWQLILPKAVDDIKQTGELLFVASLDDILIINGLNGELLHTINTQASHPVNRPSAIHFHLDDKYIYYTNSVDRSMLIYDISSYQLINKLIAPEGYSIRQCMLADELTGKLFFRLKNITQFVAQWIILELDPKEISASKPLAFTFEPEPEHSIELVPSPENSEQVELQVTLTCASLDDALRFGEIYTRDHCQWHSHSASGMRFADREPTANFNGIVRFIYSGCDRPEKEVLSHLAIMEKRFARFVESQGFYSSVDKRSPTKLITQYR